MKTNSLFWGVCCFMCLVFMYACENDKDERKEIENNETIENPYNYVGEEHNIWLDSVTVYVDNYETEHNVDLSNDIPLLINICSDYMYSKGFDTLGVNQNTNNVLTNISNAYRYVIDTLELTSSTKSELYRILNFVMEKQVENRGISCVDAMLAVIKDEESRILNNQYSIPDKEKVVVLRTTSTLKASLSYWESTQMASKEKGTIVAIADAIGALGGHTMSVLASKAAEKRLKNSINVTITGSTNNGFVVRY